MYNVFSDIERFLESQKEECVLDEATFGKPDAEKLMKGGQRGSSLVIGADKGVRRRAEQVNSIFRGIEGNTIIYNSRSDGKVWTQYIQANIKKGMPQDKLRAAILGGNLRIWCDCPAFKYWGYNYIMTHKDAVLSGKENKIYPKVRNPRLQGTVCKHLYAVVTRLDRDSSTIFIYLKRLQ